jgi:hypothetical protein
MATVSEIVLKRRVEEGKKVMLRGENIHGEFCKVFYFRCPDYFQEYYFVGITVYATNLTYSAEMSDAEVNSFFETTFNDNPEFLATLDTNHKFSFVGNDI